MKIAEKLVELEYNEQVALAIVEKDEDLRSMFLDETQLKSFVLIRTLLKEGKLGEPSRDFLRRLFDSVILTKPSLIEQYGRLLTTGIIEEVVETKTTEIESDEVVVTPTVVEEKKEKIAEKTAVSKLKKENELPRRYGRESILKDIEKQDGKATNLQLTALASNDLKNLWVNLSARLIKDMFSDNTKLSDEEYRSIRSTIKILENKIKPILKKK